MTSYRCVWSLSKRSLDLEMDFDIVLQVGRPRAVEGLLAFFKYKCFYWLEYVSNLPTMWQWEEDIHIILRHAQNGKQNSSVILVSRQTSRRFNTTRICWNSLSLQGIFLPK